MRVSDSIQKAYSDYLQIKTFWMTKKLNGIGIGHLCPRIVPTPVEKGYRSRAKFKIYGRPGHHKILGTNPMQGEVPASQAMWILPVWGRKLVQRLIQVLTAHLTDFWVDGFEVQLAHGSEQAHVTLAVKRSEMRAYSRFADHLLTQIVELTGVAVPSQRESSGQPYLRHNILGREFFSHHAAFFQSNIPLTPRILEEARTQYQNKDFLRLVDLYCGVGLFSLFLQNRASEIVGIESNRWAVESARKNSARSGFANAFFLCEPVEKYVQKPGLKPGDSVIVNPPRSGCPPSVIEAIAKQGPCCVFSISCYLPTHIRDLDAWIRKGYAVRSIAAFDMFPFTEYLETMAFLEKSKLL